MKNKFKRKESKYYDGFCWSYRFKTRKNKVYADKIYFRDSFYDNFHKLFVDGYLDVTVLQTAPNSYRKIRF